MGVQKEREAFEAHIKSTYPMGEQLAKDCGKTLCELYSSEWQSWQAAKSQAVPGWISVDDELPTPNKTFSDAVIAWDGICVRRIPLCLFNSASEVTHWMPIPQPPKAQEPAND